MNKRILITIIVLAIIAIILFFTMILPNINKGFNNTGQNQVNIKTSNVQGVKIETLKEGEGDRVSKNSDTVSLNYITTLENGQKVDSSYDHKAFATFKLVAGEVIKGWDIGAIGMKVGETRRLTIPANLAYGSEGSKSLNIPKDAILISVIQLVTIK